MKYVVASLILLLVCACSGDPEPVDCEVSGPIISLGTVTHATSCSIPDGAIRVSASGGKEPYLFSLNDGPGQVEGAFDGLAAGAYTVIVTDANACARVVENVAIKATDFMFATAIVSDTDCLSGNGQVTINVEALNPPYSYRFGTGAFGTNNVFGGLPVGTYSFTVSDNNGCSVMLNVSVPRGFSGTSWQEDVRPIIVKSCALSGCHNGDSRPDLRLFENAKFYAKSIKSKTKDKSMPREGTLTQQEIDLIACWVDDGAVLN